MDSLATVHPDCRLFVQTVEDLLARRRHEVETGTLSPHTPVDDGWGPRKWHSTELDLLVYTSYKRMRQGHITRPPRRAIVMEIADYLRANLAERNRLLVAANATPIEPYHTGAQLHAYVDLLQDIGNHLPFPVMIINRDWRIHAINDHLATIYALGSQGIQAIPEAYRSLFSLIFNPDLPLYAYLTAHQPSWHQMACQIIYGFKTVNLLCQYEPWYHDAVTAHVSLPYFDNLWQSINPDIPSLPGVAPTEDLILQTTLPCLQDASQLASLRPLAITMSYSPVTFPQIIGFFPADAKTRSLFRTLGIPCP